MVARNSLIKTAFVFSSTLTLSMAIALPSFAQAQSIEADIAETTTTATTATTAATEHLIQAPAETEVTSGSPTDAPQVPTLTASEAEAPELETLAAEISVTETLENASDVRNENANGIMQPIESADESADESAENSEVAMAELVEALNADMDEIQARAKPAEGIAAQTSEQAEAITAEVSVLPGASAIGELTSASLANSKLSAQSTPLNLATLSSLSGSSLSGSPLSDSPLSEIEADSVPALKAALNSDNTLTQLYAADALWTLTRDSDLVLPALISAATSGSFQTRELATLGLSYLGRQAIPAIPFLNRLLGDGDSRVRSIVQDTLEIVGSNNRPATTLGILARESSQRQGIIPTALSVLTRLWQ